jgi:hypothetical protein
MVKGEVFSLLNSFMDFGTTGASFKTLIIFTLVLVFYSVFIFYFYRFLARKNVINLDLSKYNKYEFGGVYRFFAIFFFILEYIIILPFVTFFWFGVLSILILLLAQGLTPTQVLIASVSLIGAIRITSFISEDLSRDLAKMIPLALLALALTSGQFFDLGIIIGKLDQVKPLLANAISFLVYIVIIEIVLRIFDFIGGLFRKKESDSSEEGE